MVLLLWCCCYVVVVGWLVGWLVVVEKKQGSFPLQQPVVGSISCRMSKTCCSNGGKGSC